MVNINTYTKILRFKYTRLDTSKCDRTGTFADFYSCTNKSFIVALKHFIWNDNYQRNCSFYTFEDCL